MSLSILPVSPSDAPDLAKIHYAAFSTSKTYQFIYKNVTPSDWITHFGDTLQGRLEIAAKMRAEGRPIPTTPIKVCNEDGKIVGYAIFAAPEITVKEATQEKKQETLQASAERKQAFAVKSRFPEGTNEAAFMSIMSFRPPLIPTAYRQSSCMFIESILRLSLSDIRNLQVDPEYKDKGVVNAILEWIGKQADATDAEVVAQVDPGNFSKLL